MPTRLKYKEGDWFAVPLRRGGFAAGIVTRAPEKGYVLLGYFFGPARSTPPSLDDVSGLRPETAVLIGLFGDLGLQNGSWPVIGHVEPWRRKDWPMVDFVRTDSVSGAMSRVSYSDDGENIELRSVPCSGEVARDLPKDAVHGYGAIEIILGKILAPVADGKTFGGRSSPCF